MIVVIDGGPQAAADEARTAAAGRDNVRVIDNDVNRGKGYSVRRGFSEARGDRLVFIDADLSLPIEDLPRMMARFDAGADVGDRVANRAGRRRGRTRRRPAAS